MDQALLSFTPALSKKLIAKGVSALPEVRQAINKGKILISTGSTAAHIYLELCGNIPDSALACGMVTEKGMCVGHGMTDFLGAHGYAKFWFFDQGQLVQTEDLDPILDDLSSEDIFIKGANAIDSKGQVGVMLGMENGGTTGRAIGHVMAKGVHFIIPVGLEKTVLGSIQENARNMGIRKVRYSSGMPVGLVPVCGTVVSETQALEALANVQVLHVASGGISGGEGSVTLLLRGKEQEIEKVIRIYSELRDDNRLGKMDPQPALCAKHKWGPCIQKNMFYKDNVKKGI